MGKLVQEALETCYVEALKNVGMIAGGDTKLVSVLQGNETTTCEVPWLIDRNYIHLYQTLL